MRTEALDTIVTYLGRTNTARNDRTFGIRQKDRRSHIAIIGKTGTGKSTLLQSIVCQDIAAGRGCALIDPHGDLVRNVAAQIPRERRNHVVLLDATDPDVPYGFNPLAYAPDEHRALVAAGIVEVFKKLWSEEWGPRLEHILRNVVFTLLERPGSTLLDIPPLLTDREFRNPIVADIGDPIVKAFWTQEFDRYTPGMKSMFIAPLQNKIGALLTDPRIRRILVHPIAPLDLRATMDQGGILLVNLDKGQIGEGPASILGSFLVSQLALAAVQRSQVAEADRRDFSIVLDEFQTFTTLSIASMMAELRKFRVGMVLANQHLSQLDPAIRDAVYGNAGTLLSFRVGAKDGEFLAREFAPTFQTEDLVSLPRYHMYVRLLIDGEATRPFSAVSLPPTVT
jgi:energy-coupling factor transporter ATP-binding protein EcfA2